jgi:hypothetical protein
MYFLIVKGSPEQAIAAAAKYNLPMMLSQSRSDQETWGYTDSNNWRPVSAWFLADCHEKAPFAPGSLLWYREVNAA